MLSVGPSADFFLSLILWKPEHLIFIFYWNFHCQLKSNLRPLLERCVVLIELNNDDQFIIARNMMKVINHKLEL